MTFSCAEPVSIAVTFTDSRSFLQLPGLTSWSSGIFYVALQFRTWNKAGLLLTFELPQQGGSVWLYLNDSRLRLQISEAGRTQLLLRAGQQFGHFAESCKIRTKLWVMGCSSLPVEKVVTLRLYVSVWYWRFQSEWWSVALSGAELWTRSCEHHSGQRQRCHCLHKCPTSSKSWHSALLWW